MAKPPPLDRPIAPPRGPNAGLSRPFPVLTPQSYIPGGTGLFPGIPPGRGSNFPMLNQNSFLPPGGGLEPPIMNLSGGTGMLPPPMPYPPMVGPPQMSYPNQNMMSIAPQPTFYEPGLRSCSRRRPVRMCRRRRRTRRCRPVIQIIDSSSCSSLSSCGTRSSCSRRRHHSHSRRRASTPQQQQQPIILLPIQCQQPAPTPAPNPNPPQAQQIILPPIQVQQSGQIQPQQFALPPMSSQQQFALPPISSQQQFSLPPIQLSSSNFANNAGSMIIPSGQPMLPTTLSLPQITNIGQGQPMQSGVIQYVQGGRQSSSPLQYVSAQPRSTVALQRGVVNSSNKNQSTIVKTVARSASVRNVPQNDLKYGRRPFDWYESERKNNIIDENTRIGQRGSTSVR